MKRLIIIVFLLSSISLASQNFEGILVNSINYESKDSSVSSEQLNSLLGTKQFYAIKEGNYKSVFNGLFIKLQIYKIIEKELSKNMLQRLKISKQRTISKLMNLRLKSKKSLLKPLKKIKTP